MIVLASLPELAGQSLDFKHFQVENGLSNNAVICSVQDHTGFMWFGTKDGLNRFDGYSFKVFRNNPDDPKSIGSNFIYTLFENEKGALWIGTEKGLYKYNPVSECFSQLKEAGDLPISECTADKEGHLWFISGLTLYEYDEKTKSIIVYDPASFFEATGVCLSPSGEIWVSTSNGLLKKYNSKLKTFQTFDLFQHSAPVASKWVEKIQSTNDGKILVGTGSAGLKFFNTKDLTYKDVPLQNDGKTDLFVRNFLQASADEFWIGTESGIFIYNSKTGKTINIRKKYNDPFSLSDNAVYTFCKDKEGGIWSGTYFGGVNYYSRQNTPFKKYIPKVGENSLSGNVVREIREDKKGNLWIGTEDAGLNKLDAATGKFIHFKPSGTKGSISYSNIHGLLLSGDELWIGTFEHGLDVMNTKTGKVVKHFSTTQGVLKSNFIYCIYETRKGDILIGTTIGIYRYNRVKKELEALPGMPLYNWFTSILEDVNGTIWTGTYGNGINYYDPVTSKFVNIRHIPSDKNSLSSDRVNSVFEDKSKNLWFATENGLCKWLPATRSFKRYSTADGFPSNFVMNVLEDEKNQLWISTTKGLVCFQPKTEKVQVFTIANGLLSDQFNFSSAFKDSEGRMYFGSAKGLVSFHPSEFFRNHFTPPVYITGFQVNNQEMQIASKGSSLKNAITFTKSITLTHDQSTFSIDFAALGYTAPEMLEYAYQMEGLSTGWTYLKTNRKVYFTELAPKTYVFKVKATNNSGIWNGKETRLVIRILPPWWRSWLAYSAYALLTVFVVAFFIRNYHKKMQEKGRRDLELLELAKEKELYQAKMEFFTNVAHEIRTPLTLIKGPLEKVFRKAGDIKEIQTSLRIMDRNTNRLLELTNQLLDFRQTEINGFSLSFTEVNISELLDEASQSFSLLGEQKGVRFNLKLPSDQVFAFVDREAFIKIIYNLLGNAVKYAESSVQLTLFSNQPTDSYFTIQVENDGAIIPAHLREKIFEPFFRIKGSEKEKGTGIGLALTRSLVQLHKGEIKVEESIEKLNRFHLTLPVHQESELRVSNTSKKQIEVQP